MSLYNISKSNVHPLTRAHIADVLKTPRSEKTKMMGRYAIAYHPDAVIVPAGRTTMQVLIPVFSGPGHIARIDSIGIRFSVDGRRIVSRTVLQYDGFLSPDVQATGKRMNPLEGVPSTPVRSGDTGSPRYRPNGDWVRKFLNAWNDMRQAVHEFPRDLDLPAVPATPRLMAGFKTQPDVPTALSDFGVELTGGDASQLTQESWQMFMLKPDDESNPTGMFLVPAAVYADMPTTAALYEDFTELVTRRQDGSLEGITQTLFQTVSRELMVYSIPVDGYTYEMDMTGWKRQVRQAPAEAAQAAPQQAAEPIEAMQLTV